jgi:hypothetical protein
MLTRAKAKRYAIDWIGVIALGVLMGWYAAKGIAQ